MTPAARAPVPQAPKKIESLEVPEEELAEIHRLSDVTELRAALAREVWGGPRHLS